MIAELGESWPWNMLENIIVYTVDELAPLVNVDCFIWSNQIYINKYLRYDQTHT